jgi:Phytanoyl-CoA dioxygenase (PhyH)
MSQASWDALQENGRAAASNSSDRPLLTQAQIADYRERGFVSLPRIAPPDEVAALLPVFQRLFANKAGRKEGAQYDMLGYDEEGQPMQKSPVIINPVDYASELRRLNYRSNALAIARQLLGPKAVPSFEQVILKPPRFGGPTPWHQDEAYRYDPNFEYRSVSFWMPLQDATVENGCMHYIPGSHKLGVVRHRSVNDDPRIHAIEAAGGFDPSTAEAVPLPAGATVMHDARALHYAGPNRSEGARYAYILAFEVPPTPVTENREFDWNKEKQAAHLQRQREWRRKGGVFIELWRKLRRGVWLRPGQLAFEFRRVLNALRRR